METVKVYSVLDAVRRAARGIYIAIFCAVSLITTLVAISISNRGLDLTDESFYILSSVYPDRQVSGLSFFHFFTAQIWNVTQSIHFFRLSSIIISVVISCVLVKQISMYLPSNSIENQGKSFLAVFASFLVYGTLINFSPSYNLMVAWITPVVVLLIFRSLTMISNRESLKYVIGSAIGLLLVFNVKFSTSFAVLFVVAIFAVCFPAIDRKVIVRRLLSLILTFVFLIVIELAVLKIGSFDFQYFSNGYVALSQIQSEGAFSHFLVVVVRTLKRLGYLILVIIGFLLVHRLSRTFKRNVRVVFYIIYGVFISILLNLFYASSGNWTGQALAFHVIMCFFLYTNRSRLQESRETKSLILILLSLPYVMSFGTNNIYFEQTLFYLAPWSLVLLILDQSGFQKVFRQGSFVMSAVVSLHLVSSLFTPAYGLEESYIRNTVPVKVNEYGTLLFSSSQARFVHEISALRQACQVSDGFSFMGFENSGGLAIPLGMPPLGNSWTTSKYQAELNLSDPKGTRQILIAFRSPFVDDKNLVPAELDFPDSFELCARVALSDRQIFVIWKRK